jgi:hypothetical protein
VKPYRLRLILCAATHTDLQFTSRPPRPCAMITFVLSVLGWKAEGDHPCIACAGLKDSIARAPRHRIADQGDRIRALGVPPAPIHYHFPRQVLQKNPLIACLKPTALHPVTKATIKALTCFCLFCLRREIEAPRGPPELEGRAMRSLLRFKPPAMRVVADSALLVGQKKQNSEF